MLNKKNKKMCDQIIKHYGRAAQLMMMVEESAELTKAICKMFRTNDVRECSQEFVEELTDLIVMAQQCLRMYGIKFKEIDERAEVKLVRTINHIKGEEE